MERNFATMETCQLHGPAVGHNYHDFRYSVAAEVLALSHLLRRVHLGVLQLLKGNPTVLHHIPDPVWCRHVLSPGKIYLGKRQTMLWRMACVSL